MVSKRDYFGEMYPTRKEKYTYKADAKKKKKPNTFGKRMLAYQNTALK
jgi:hypothetical protein